MGQHDADYVDAYYGPADWKKKAEAEKKSLEAIGAEARQLGQSLAQTSPSGGEIERLRQEYLTKQLSALETRVRIVKGERMKFDDESRALYDAVAPDLPGFTFPGNPRQARTEGPGLGSAAAALRGMEESVHYSEGEARRRFPVGHQGMPCAHHRAHEASAG